MTVRTRQHTCPIRVATPDPRRVVVPITVAVDLCETGSEMERELMGLIAKGETRPIVLEKGKPWRVMEECP